MLVKGAATLFYQDGFPLSLTIEEFNNRGIEVSLLHIADQCWNNGWSPKTILNKVRGECGLDINKVMSGIDWNELEHFCDCLEQPKRSLGGYEESREMIFKYLFGDNPEPLAMSWLIEVNKQL